MKLYGASRTTPLETPTQRQQEKWTPIRFGAMLHTATMLNQKQRPTSRTDKLETCGKSQLHTLRAARDAPGIFPPFPPTPRPNARTHTRTDLRGLISVRTKHNPLLSYLIHRGGSSPSLGGGVLWRYSGGTPEVLSRYCEGTVKVLRRYCEGTVKVL